MWHGKQGYYENESFPSLFVSALAQCLLCEQQYVFMYQKHINFHLPLSLVVAMTNGSGTTE